jgi:hypothetical protein
MNGRFFALEADTVSLGSSLWHSAQTDQNSVGCSKCKRRRRGGWTLESGPIPVRVLGAQGFTTPMCACDLAREQDEERRRMRESGR